MQIEIVEAEPAAQASTAIIPADQRAALALNATQTEKDLIVLATKHAGITEIKDKAGREQAHGAAMELMRARTAIKKVADEARDDAKKFNAAVIAVEKRLTAIVEPEETRLKALRDAWDTEQERIKAEKAEAERQRILKITERIAAIKAYASTVMGCRTAERANDLLCKLHAVDMAGFDEFEAEAARAHLDAITAVSQQRDVLVEREAEAARLKAEREELARQQAEARRQAEEREAAQKAEADRLEAERAELARKQQEAADEIARQQAEIQRMRDELEAAKATVPAEVAPEKQPLAHAVAVIADVGIALADDLLVSKAPDAGLVYADTCSDIVDAEISSGFDAAIFAKLPSLDLKTDDAPPAASLIRCIAEAYSVDEETACQWLIQRHDEFEGWTPAVDSIA